MKIKDGFKLCKVRDNSIVVATGNVVLDFNGLVTLNDSGEFIWSLLEKGCERDDIVAELVKEYGIDISVAENDADEYIDKLKGAGFLE